MKQFLVLIFFVFILSGATAQVVVSGSNERSILAATPQEEVYITLNTKTLLTGEYIYYQIHVFNSVTKQRSKNSKIAYFDIVGAGNSFVCSQKVVLKNGIGNGDFFIPTSVTSGNYKVFGYTNWMRNAGLRQFFQTDIRILNPYQSSGIASALKVAQKDTLTYIKEDVMKGVDNIKKYGKRAEVVLTTEDDILKALPEGEYTLSVRKISSLDSLPFQSTTTHFSPKDDRASLVANAPIYMPELRGELLYGKVTTNDPSLSIANVGVAISFETESPYLKIVRTNSEGGFAVTVDQKYDGSFAYITLLDVPDNAMSVQMIPRSKPNYTTVQFPEFVMPEKYTSEIVSRSIHNQIENAFFSNKPDSIVPSATKALFTNLKKTTYQLDDYTRFKTMKETIVEIISDVTVKRISRAIEEVHIKTNELKDDPAILPLVLLNGVVQENHTIFLARDARKAIKVNVYRDIVVIGAKQYEGVLEVETTQEDLEDSFLYSRVTKAPIYAPQSEKRYFKQRYTTASVKSRIPDDRLQLLWQPNFTVTEKIQPISFYTSDISGMFKVRISGFSSDGKLQNRSTTFRVK